MEEKGLNCCADNHTQDQGCCECDCACHDPRPKHWTDAIKYLAEASVVIGFIYCVTQCFVKSKGF